MATVQQQVTVRGVPILNTDEKMKITLTNDAEGKVKIQEPGGIEDTQITYEFVGSVAQNTPHNVEVTFLYDGKYKVAVPLVLTQTAAPDISIEDTPLSVEMWENGATVPFKVKVGGVEVVAEEVTRLPHANVVDYSTVGGTAGNWYITGVAQGSSVTPLEVDYTYKLPVANDPAQLVRTAKGTFNVAAYDGTELTVTETSSGLDAAAGAAVDLTFEVFYKGIPKPAESIEVQADSDYGTLATYVSDTGADNIRTLKVTAGTAGTGNLSVHFGPNGSEHTEHKVVSVSARVFENGLVLKTASADIVGHVDTDHQVSLVFEHNGVAVDTDQLTLTPDNYITKAAADATTVTWTIVDSNMTEADVVREVTVTVEYSGASTTYKQKVTVQSNPPLVLVDDFQKEGEGEEYVVLNQQTKLA